MELYHITIFSGNLRIMINPFKLFIDDTMEILLKKTLTIQKKYLNMPLIDSGYLNIGRSRTNHKIQIKRFSWKKSAFLIL